jgi:hypothetical protein
MLQNWYLDNNRFLLTRADNISHVIELNHWKHVATGSLLSRSLDTAALTTEHFKDNSLTGVNFGDASIASSHVIAKSFDHGGYYVKKVNNSALIKIDSYDNGELMIGARFGSGLVTSTDGGITLANPLTDANVVTAHGTGDHFVALTNASHVFRSTNKAASFTQITTTPFDAFAQAGWVFDDQNFIVIGKSGNNLIPAKYDVSDNALRELKSVDGTVVITSGVDVKPRKLVFVDGSTGYLSVVDNFGGYIFKTTDRGYTWSVVHSDLTATLKARLDLLDKDHLYFTIDTDLYSLNPKTLLHSFSAGIQGVCFVAPNIGFVAVQEKLYMTMDGGENFTLIYTAASNFSEITRLSFNRALATGSDGLFLIEPKLDYQPFVSLESTAFNSDTGIYGYQIRENSLTNAKLSSHVINSDNVADESIDGAKIVPNSISKQKIRSFTLPEGLFAYDSLTASKLGSDAITAMKVKTGILTTVYIKNYSISEVEISSDLSLDGDSMGIGAVTSDKIANWSVESEHVATKQILNYHLKTDGLLAGDFKDQIFEDHHFQFRTIQSDRFNFPNSISNLQIASDTLTGASLTDGEIDSNLIDDSSLYGYLFEPGTLTENLINAPVIGPSQWLNYSINNSILHSKIVTDGLIADNSVDGVHFSSNAPDLLSRDKFANTSIGNVKITDLSLTSREFLDGSIGEGKFSTSAGMLLKTTVFASNIVTDGKIGGLLNQDKFADDSFTTAKMTGRIFINSKFASQMITDGQLMDKGLLNEDFADDSIISNKLANNRDYGPRFNADAVLGSKIISHSLQDADFVGNIAQSKIDNDQVIFGTQIGNVNISKVADHSITGKTIQRESFNKNILTAGAITNSKIVDKTIGSAKIADDFITLGDINSNVLISSNIKNFSIENNDLAGGITGNKIVDGSLDSSEFVNEFLFNDKIQTNQLDHSKIKLDTITGREIADGIIDTAHIQDNSLTTSVFALNEITGGDIDTQEIRSDLIIDGTILERHIKFATLDDGHVNDGDIREGHFIAGSIHGPKLAANLSQAKLADSAITTDKLNENAFNRDKFGFNQILGRSIIDNAVNSSLIADGSLTGTFFATGVNQDRLAGGSISLAKLYGTGFNSDKIEDYTLLETKIAPDTLISGNFATDAVTSGSIALGTVPVNRFTTGSITQEKLAQGSLTDSAFAVQTLTSGHITDFSLTNGVLSITGLTANNVETASLTWSNLADDAVTTTHIPPYIIETDFIGASQIPLNYVTAGMTGNHVADGTLKPENFLTEFDADKIADYAISNAKLSASGFAQSKFADGISRNTINDGAVTAAKISAGSPLFTQDMNPDADYGDALTAVAYGDTGTEWANDVVATSDGGAAIVGYAGAGWFDGHQGDANDISVLKLTPTRQVQWKFAYGFNTSLDKGNAIIQDGTKLVVAGSTQNGGGGGTDAFVIDMNLTTGVAGNKADFGGAGSDHFYNIIKTSDGGYLMVGYTDSATISGYSANADFFVVKTDSAFAPSWSFAYGGSENDFAESAVEDQNGDFIIVGSTASPEFPGFSGVMDVAIVKINSSGTEIYKRAYGSTGNDQAKDCVLARDGGVVITGYSNSTLPGFVSGADILAMKISADGATDFMRLIGGNGTFDYGHSVSIASDDGIIIGGATNSSDYEGYQGSHDFAAIKLDAAGGLVWKKAYGGTGDDRAYGVAQLSDSKYLLVGYTNSTYFETYTGGSDYGVVTIHNEPKVEPYSITQTNFDSNIPGSKVAMRALTSGNLSGQISVHEMPLNTDEWFPALANINTAIVRAAHTVFNNKLYVFGGGSTQPQVYDPSNNSWTLKNVYAACNLTGTVAAGYGKYIYLFGGWNSGPSSNVWRYEPITDTWTDMQTMPGGVADSSIAVLNDEFWIVAGKTRNIYKFNPRTASFITYTDALPEYREQAAVAVYKDRFYVFGGKNGGVVNTIYRCESTGACTTITDTLPGLLHEHQAVTFNEKIYIIGGLLDGGATDKVFEFTPLTDSMNPVPVTNLTGGNRALHFAQVLNNAIIIGSGSAGTPNATLKYRPAAFIPANKIASGGLNKQDIFTDDTNTDTKLFDSNYIEDNSIGSANIAADMITKAKLDNTDARFQKLMQMAGEPADATHADGLHWHSRATTPTCPSGFTRSGNMEFCISSASSPNEKVAGAWMHCRNQDAHLCSMQELYQACKANSGVVNGNTYHVSDFNATKGMAVRVDTGTCDFTSDIYFSDFTAGGYEAICCLNN